MKPISGGHRDVLGRGAVAVKPDDPYTSSPGLKSVTPDPMSAMTPDTSWDGMVGVRLTPSRVQVSTHVSSSNVMAADRTATSASSLAGMGTGADSTSRTSGPPGWCARSAVISVTVLAVQNL